MRRVIALGALTIVAVAGCASGKADLGDELADVSLTDGKSDLPSSVHLVGSLDYNTTSDPVAYDRTQAFYLAYKFAGNKGDQVDITVRAKDGDAYAYLRDDSFKLLARNDDADQTTRDSHISFTLPGNSNPDSNTYYVVFREYAYRPSSFTVELKGPATDFFSCQADTDCVAVPEVGCCRTGYNAAVNVGQVDAYEGSFTCPVAHPVCEQSIVADPRVAQCNSGTHQCEMVAIEDIQCGGYLPSTQHKCPDNYTCKLPFGAPSGKCYENDPPPAQDCASVGGYCSTDICKPGDGVVGASCGGGGVCCAPTTQPSCTTTGCPAGQYCAFCFTQPVCIPNGAQC